MTYVVQRKDRFDVVDYDGLDPLTGKERRRWHPVGGDRAEAQAVAARLGAERMGSAKGGPTTCGESLSGTWLPQKRRTVRATTGYRYAWFVEHYINPAIGEIPLRRLRADHLDSLYENLAGTGGRDGTGLAPKTILEVHMIIRAALDQAVQRHLVVRNVAHHANARRRPPTTGPARIWTAAELSAFLHAARPQRLYPALHLAAHTGLRRGELAGLRWSDLDDQTGRLSVCRTLQTFAGRPVEFGVKTRTSRRTVDLDQNTIDVLNRWRHRLRHDGLPYGPDEAMFPNTKGRSLHPESVSQLFVRLICPRNWPLLPEKRWGVDLRVSRLTFRFDPTVPASAALLTTRLSRLGSPRTGSEDATWARAARA